MNTCTRLLTVALVSGSAWLSMSRSLLADAAPPRTFSLAAAVVDDPAGTDAATLDRTTIESTETIEEEECPASLELSYGIYTDYVWRGVNFSEYDGEGREKLNHQLNVNLELDLAFLNAGDLGSVGFNTWFEWYAAQHELDPQLGGQNLQEVDYTVYWTRTFEPIHTDITLSYLYYQYVNFANILRQDGDPGNNNDDRTQEYTLLFEHNDAWLWQSLFPDNEDGILNPSLLFAHDFGSMPGFWFEFGISHDFAIPGLDNLTITPGYTLLAQCDYWKNGFFLAGDQLSLATSYDLTDLLNLPESAGSLSVGTELYFFNAYGNFEGTTNNNEVRSQDEFWGGLSMTWAWPG